MILNMSILLKNKINKQLNIFVKEQLNHFKLDKTDALLASGIKDFVLREGKRIRPIFFLISYLGYASNKKVSSALIKTSLSFELLHDFLLIHDDIIDNSLTRRGKPTLHKIFEKALKQTEKTGQDLSIVAGDIVYAMAINAFLCAEPLTKSIIPALKEFLKSTILTGAGEFIDIRNGLTHIKNIQHSQIRTNYLLKTAEYTFKSPLYCGCLLAEKSVSEAKKIASYGQCLGEAFQIQDDIIGIFATSKAIGKSVLSDIIEAKKTLPMYLAYQHSSKKERLFLESCLGNSKLCYEDLLKIRKIITKTGAYEQSKKEILSLLGKANRILATSKMDNKYKDLLSQKATDFIKIN